jgi:hypothetical protein
MATGKPDDEIHGEVGAAAPPPEARPDEVKAWEMIADGRYMPRRVRGSCHGRELG